MIANCFTADFDFFLFFWLFQKVIFSDTGITFYTWSKEHSRGNDCTSSCQLFSLDKYKVDSDLTWRPVDIGPIGHLFTGALALSPAIWGD